MCFAAELKQSSYTWHLSAFSMGGGLSNLPAARGKGGQSPESVKTDPFPQLTQRCHDGTVV